MASKSVYMPKDEWIRIRVSKLQKQEIKTYADKHFGGDESEAIRVILDEKLNPEVKVERQRLAG